MDVNDDDDDVVVIVRLLMATTVKMITWLTVRLYNVLRILIKGKMTDVQKQ
jgi:hypothetical protein